MPVARLALAPVLLGLCGSLAACHGGGSRRLEGHWRGLRAEGVAGAAAAAANAFATGMTLEVKGDAITVTTPKERQSGHYKVVSEDKTRLVITTDKDGPTEPQTFTFVDDKTLRWAVTGPESIVFSRQ